MHAGNCTQLGVILGRRSCSSRAFCGRDRTVVSVDDDAELRRPRYYEPGLAPESVCSVEEGSSTRDGEPVQPGRVCTHQELA